MGVFVNFSNHPSSKWGPKQIAEAQKYGEVVDIAFPKLNADLSEEDIEAIGNEIVEEIVSLNPTAVMCQGEFTLTHYVVARLSGRGISCLSACSERISQEIINADGTVSKVAIFEFVRFREYM